MLVVEGLSARYGPIVAVRDLSFRVEHGEIVTLLGANGAGKTTTLAAIMGIVRPSAGRVAFDGRDVTGLSPEAIVRLGMTLSPEGRRIFAGLTVEENVALGAASRRDRPAVARDRERILALFPVLEVRLRQLAGTLSGGEQQQLAIARALMSGPRMLLLDEPSLGLAPMFVDLVFGLIQTLRRDFGLTILLVEQNVDRALQVSDRGYVLASGTLRSSGTSAELRSSDLEREYLGIGAEA
jgi:branched-chain amino acid transport system ATP-binding protein